MIRVRLVVAEAFRSSALRTLHSEAATSASAVEDFVTFSSIF